MEGSGRLHRRQHQRPAFDLDIDTLFPGENEMGRAPWARMRLEELRRGRSEVGQLLVEHPHSSACGWMATT